MRKLKNIAVLLLLGLICVFVVLESGVRIFGLVSGMRKNTANLEALNRDGTVRVLCLGDSMTHDQYPRFLEQALSGIDRSVKFSVFDEGVAGSNSSQLMSRVPELLERYEPDFVVCMMGCNDDDDTQILDYGDVRSERVYKWMRRIRSFELLYMLWWNLKQKNCVQEKDGAAFEKNRRGELEDIIAREPGNAAARFELAEVLAADGLNDEALEQWRIVQELAPSDIRVYGRLVTFCPQEEKGKWVDAALELKKAGQGIAFEEITSGLLRLGRFDEAFKLAREGIDKKPQNAELYSLAAFSCMRRREYDSAHAVLKEGLSECPGELVLVRMLNGLYSAELVSPDPELEKKLYQDTAYALPVLERNYARLGRLTAERGAVLIGVQYPTLDVHSLERMLAGHENVCFVDNGREFCEAVAREGYGAVFLDNFGGSFGHCTDYGNRLLAGSVARVITGRIENGKK